MSASSSALKQALKRVSQRCLVDRSASRLAPQASSRLCATKQHQPPRQSFSSATASSSSSSSAHSDEEELYGGEPSPITEYLNLAVQGIDPDGPPTTSDSPEERIVLKCGIPEDEITFKTASYQRLLMAPYVQHQEHKVTLSVQWDRLPLDDFEKRILMEIVGTRYRPDKNELRLTSEQFGSRIENKRHLTSMLDRLVFAARKLAKEAKSGSAGSNTTITAED